MVKISQCCCSEGFFWLNLTAIISTGTKEKVTEASEIKKMVIICAPGIPNVTGLDRLP